MAALAALLPAVVQASLVGVAGTDNLGNGLTDPLTLSDTKTFAASPPPSGGTGNYHHVRERESAYRNAGERL